MSKKKRPPEPCITTKKDCYTWKNSFGSGEVCRVIKECETPAPKKPRCR